MLKKVIIGASIIMATGATLAIAHGGRGERAFRAGARMERMADELGLTTAQRAEIKAIHERARDASLPAREEMRKLRQEYAAIEDKNSQRAEEIEGLMERHRDRMQAERQRVRAEVDKVLTPEQRARHDEMREQRREQREERMERRGGGRGPGRGDF